MSHRKLIVARLERRHTEPVARLFAESDATELPHMLGVTRRTLFAFHDLYFHLVETDEELSGPLRDVRSHPLFRSVDEGLAEYVRPYDPGWREPADAMAAPFYEWRRP
ncbi:TcmI family type II polyketide cyclase [Streptosporangium sandarakinum]|uniref:Polyketide synthase n=1 Tax=Streptosporangium pseudovulgare TaxID=35765 RepID=A0ABQ2R8P3_9ACTN|nr:TcmI family type II polyketide cyclase [Streptosporangium pseudovulgare]GGQ19406.1 polyketide synthase [Streptosporangium pseudovulgare]